ncbi:Crp/Fnr family transcriptional regulator [Bacillaceae bacterium S4-13-58]
MNEFRQSKMLQVLPEEMLEEYVYHCRTETFARKEIAFQPYGNSEYMYLVLHGRIRVTLNYTNGKEFTITVLENGDVYSGHARGLGIALEKTEVVFLPLRIFRKMIVEYPEFAVKVIATVGSTLETTFDVIENLVFRDVSERIAAFILSLIDSKGKVSSDGIAVPLGLTQEEIATIVGSTRQTVNTILTLLQKENIISLSKKEIVIFDKARLSSLCNKIN